MKTRKLLSILTGIALLSGGVAFAQGARHGQDDIPRPEPTRPIFDPDIAEMRASLAALQAELAAARRDLVASLEGIPVEERREAMERFREENADLVAGIRDLAESIRDAAAEYRPERPERPSVPEEIIATRQELAGLRSELARSRAAVLSGLDEDATREDIAEALAEWRAENAETIEKASDLQTIVDGWFAENRPAQRGPGRDVDPELAERRMNFRESARAMRENRAAAREQLRGASADEREALMMQLREQQRELLQERRDLRRMERMHRDPGGDRRPGG